MKYEGRDDLVKEKAEFRRTLEVLKEDPLIWGAYKDKEEEEYSILVDEGIIELAKQIALSDHPRMNEIAELRGGLTKKGRGELYDCFLEIIKYENLKEVLEEKRLLDKQHFINPFSKLPPLTRTGLLMNMIVSKMADKYFASGG